MSTSSSGSPRLDDLAQRALDLVLAGDLADGAPEVLVGGHLVHPRQRLVDAQEAQVEVEERDAQRRVAEDRVELGEVAVGGALAARSALTLNACASSAVSGGPSSGRRVSKRPAPSSRAKPWSRLTGTTIARTAAKASRAISTSRTTRPPMAIRVARVRRRLPSARSRICSARLAAAKLVSAERNACRRASLWRAAAAGSVRGSCDDAGEERRVVREPGG